MLDGEVIDKEDRNMCFSFETPKEIARGLKRIWESKMGTPSSAQIIQDFDLALKALEIFYHTNGAAFEGLAYRNGNRRKVVGEGGSVSCVGEGTKVRGTSSSSPKRCSCTVIC